MLGPTRFVADFAFAHAVGSGPGPYTITYGTISNPSPPGQQVDILDVGSGNDPTLAAEDAIGLSDFAIQRVLAERAGLGAFGVRLQEDEQNDARRPEPAGLGLDHSRS